jgi:hypothetical protein
MTTLSLINPLSIEFQPSSASVLATETEIIDGAKLHLSLLRPNNATVATSAQRCDTTQGAIIGPRETLYHLHLSDGTCLSTALHQSDKTVYQLFPEPALFANRIDWAAATLVHFAEGKPFVIHNDAQLKCDVLAIAQAERYKKIVEATLQAKQDMSVFMTSLKEKLVPSEEELSEIIGFLELDDDTFFGDEENPAWMDSARVLAKSHKPDYPGCNIKNIVKRSLYDETDIAIAKDAARMAFVMCDHKIASERAE